MQSSRTGDLRTELIGLARTIVAEGKKKGSSIGGAMGDAWERIARMYPLTLSGAETACDPRGPSVHERDDGTRAEIRSLREQLERVGEMAAERLIALGRAEQRADDLRRGFKSMSALAEERRAALERQVQENRSLRESAAPANAQTINRRAAIGAAERYLKNAGISVTDTLSVPALAQAVVRAALPWLEDVEDAEKRATQGNIPPAAAPNIPENIPAHEKTGKLPSKEGASIGALVFARRQQDDPWLLLPSGTTVNLKPAVWFYDGKDSVPMELTLENEGKNWRWP